MSKSRRRTRRWRRGSKGKNGGNGYGYVGRRRGTRTGRKGNESEATLASGFPNVTRGVICNTLILGDLIHFSLAELTSQELRFTFIFNTLQITAEWKVASWLDEENCGGIRSGFG